MHAEGLLLKKGALRWKETWCFVAGADDKRMFVYRGRHSLAPKHVINVSRCSTGLNEVDEVKKGTYAFRLTVAATQKSFLFAAKQSKVQESFMDAIVGGGAKFTETIKAEDVKAASRFELEAEDIDGNLVKFEKYQGKVCLIVNVASF